MDRSKRSTPTGPGSRGGRWHDPEYRRLYRRAWVLAHPEYQEREALRRARARAQARGDDPAGIVTPPRFPRPLPSPIARCQCVVCACPNDIVTLCGFCQLELHEEAVG